MAEMQTIGVVGAGAMGRGIVQLFAQAGHPVRCYDAVDGAVDKAIEFVTGMVNRGVEKGRQSREAGDATLAAIVPARQLDELAGCDVVIEAIVEDIGIKRDVFAKLEAVVGADTILASNTSSLLVSEIAAECERPDRVAGLHFFNPVPLMKVVEVVSAVRTAPDTVASLKALAEGAGHRAVVAADQPGFLVNHAGRGLYTEGLRLLEEQCASPQDIDTLMREAAGFRMGPFELMDLTGLDVSGKVMASIYAQFQQEPRFRPSSLIPPRIAAGLHGRKTGEGWYRYADNRKQESPRAEVPPLRDGVSVWIDPTADQCAGLRELVAQAGGREAEPDAADLLLVQPWGWDVTHYSNHRRLDATRAVGVDPLPGLDRHRCLMLSPVTTAQARDGALALLGGESPGATVINDSPGFVTQRVLATIVNIAADIAQRGIASVEDIEDAVRIGLGYPDGPLGIGERVGPARVLEVLQRLQTVTGDPRYRPSQWLTRRVALNVSLHTPEAARS